MKKRFIVVAMDWRSVCCRLFFVVVSSVCVCVCVYVCVCEFFLFLGQDDRNEKREKEGKG